MYNGREADTLRRFGVFFIDMLVVNFCINLITAPFLTYLNGELGTIDDALNKLLEAMDGYAAGVVEMDYLMNLAMGVAKYGLLVLAITLPISILVYFLYFVLQPMKTSYQTLGRKLFHTRVERIRGDNLTYGNLCLRELVGSLLLYSYLGSFVLFINIIVYFISRRTLVDHISSTNMYDLYKGANENYNDAYYNNNNNYYDNNNGYYDNNNGYDNNDNNGYYDNSYNDNDGYNNYNNDDDDDNYRPDHMNDRR